MSAREVITATDTVADSVMTMKEHGVSQLPVLEAGRVVGIITESRPAHRKVPRGAEGRAVRAIGPEYRGRL